MLPCRKPSTASALLGLLLGGVALVPMAGIRSAQARPQVGWPSPAAPSAAAVSAVDPASSGAFRYRLGPGDRLRMEVFKMEGYEANVEVLSDGTINLPRLGSVLVWGLTLDQARDRITAGYARILRRPLVYLDLLASRPVRVSISGEVQRPGLYSIGQGGSNQLTAAGTAPGGTSIQTSGPPTLLDAIQRAGGLTAYGDLRHITVQRPTAGPGSPTQTLTFDFSGVLVSGGSVVNPLLHDGDGVSVARTEELTESELLAVAGSTFAPDTISVNVVGEVAKPGSQSIKANSPLSNAILTAGGLTRRASASTVRLLRLQADGTIRQATVAYDPASPLGSVNNPPLQQGDVLVVDRHGWAKTNDTLRTAVEPIGPVLNAASIFRLLGVGF